MPRCHKLGPELEGVIEKAKVLWLELGEHGFYTEASDMEKVIRELSDILESLRVLA
jgi:hypothetical protein